MLLKIAHLNNMVIKPIPFKEDIDDSLEGFYFTEYVVFTYIDVLSFFYLKGKCMIYDYETNYCGSFFL